MGSRRKIRRVRRRQRRRESLKDSAHGMGRGAVWGLLFFLLLASLAGMAVMVLAGVPLYAFLFLPSGLLSGVALRRWGAA